VAAALPALCAALARLIERAAPWPVQAIALKTAFAGRSLHDAARRVEGALNAGDLPRAREELAWLVSRPRDQLDESLAASAAIESLAENFVDSWVAPLVAYALAGLGGAFAYRAVNTADAMWGYRTLQYEHLGKASARLDDALNWIPARLAALLLILSGSRPKHALRVWWRDAKRTASPNAGQAMAAAAGQLDVRLQKPAHYLLNAASRPPTADAIAEARALFVRATLTAAGVAILLRMRRQE
jgi:adenosylcobinamide-phosphate synthase